MFDTIVSSKLLHRLRTLHLPDAMARKKYIKWIRKMLCMHATRINGTTSDAKVLEEATRVAYPN